MANWTFRAILNNAYGYITYTNYAGKSSRFPTSGSNTGTLNVVCYDGTAPTLYITSAATGYVAPVTWEWSRGADSASLVPYSTSTYSVVVRSESASAGYGYKSVTVTPTEKTPEPTYYDFYLYYYRNHNSSDYTTIGDDENTDKATSARDKTFTLDPCPTSWYPTGYTFAGWYTDRTGGDKVSGTTTVEADVTKRLYAHWIGKYSCGIRYYANGGYFGQDKSETTAYSDIYRYTNTTSRSFTLSTELHGAGYSDPTRDGYDFVGWGVSATATETKATATITPGDPTQYANFYAIWREKYKGRIRYSPNGGEWADKTTTYKYYPTSNTWFGSTTTTKTFTLNSNINAETPVRKYYDFLGYKKTGDATFYKIGNNITVSASESGTETTLYAQWQAKKLEKFWWDGGTGSMDNALIFTGNNVSNITAERWNAMLSKINDFSAILGVSFSYATVVKGGTFTAVTFNTARNGINAIKAALGASTPLCGTVTANVTEIKAAYFTGGGSLRDALNALIDIYNNSL